MGSLCSFEHPREAGERELGRIAAHQHGCLHRRQLLAAGIGRTAIRGRLSRGQLHPLLSDVYLYGGRDPDSLSLAMAVALHLKGDGVVSDESAAQIWGITDITPSAVHVTVAGRSAHRMPGVALHRVAAMHSGDVRWRHGIPVTSPARSMIDLASHASLPRAESALAMLRRLDPASAERQLSLTLGRLPANHQGAALVRRLLTLAPSELVLTKSVYERRLRALLRQAHMAMPLSNHMVAGAERDLVWPAQRLIVEFDGWIFHRDRFREDRARDAKAVAAGWRVIRLTADRIDTERYAVIAELAAALTWTTAA